MAMAAMGCILGLTAQAAPEEAKGSSTHVLVLAAEALAERSTPEASAVAVRMALGTPGLSGVDRARVEKVKAKLRLRESNPAQRPIVTCARSLCDLIDALSMAMLPLESAKLVFQLADRCQPASSEDQAQLLLRRGHLEMEAGEDVAARRSFEEALKYDRRAQLPGIVSPKTLRSFEDVRAALPPVATVSPPPLPTPPPSASRPHPLSPSPAPTRSALASLRPWAWVPAAGGAALGVAGGALYMGAKGNYDRLASRDPSLTTMAQVHETANAGRAMQTGSFVLFGAGAVALASAAALFLTGDEVKPVQASVQMVGPGGPGVAIVGVFP